MASPREAILFLRGGIAMLRHKICEYVLTLSVICATLNKI